MAVKCDLNNFLIFSSETGDCEPVFRTGRDEYWACTFSTEFGNGDSQITNLTATSRLEIL